MKYLKLMLVLLLLLTGCEKSLLSSNNKNEGNLVENNNSSETKRIPLSVSGDLIRGFIEDSKFLGLKHDEPDNLFFEHLKAPGFSIQLEGENPDKMTGAIILISYDSPNFSRGRGTIAGLLSILIN